MKDRYTKTVDLIETNLGNLVHEAMEFRVKHGNPINAKAMCGEFFGFSDDWILGQGARTRVNCLNCKTKPKFVARTP